MAWIRLFPLSLGGEGTARIGGNLSTNAGGTGVLRYGDKFRVTAWFRDIESRINISYEVRNLSTGRRAARARTALVLLDENGELCLETPARVKERLLKAFEPEPEQ